ncbi:hypothetical protein [Lysinibacter cavernae]|uniref:Pentose-5-phosphate-3-epimerase n=1 Tax=Lysinibacter cavernae TaxID=1640652 RepID=A0A7X5R1J1_9MICO|nr:hypothetical protein [Lysinibacter cavernae]NIH53943.1 pentose-5-phosphate-3-epimerase [Lysinibacter cavernae]
MSVVHVAVPHDVTIADWADEFPASALGGSIYAVAPPLRLEAARRLADAGHGIHADLILGHEGIHTGVTPQMVREIRSALPEADIDLHLITHGTPAKEQAIAEAEALNLANDVRASRIALSPAAFARNERAITELRDAGINVWVELEPIHSANPLEAGDADGALIMLIEPGTITTADPSNINKIEALPGAWNVGVDGGVTRAIATTSHAAGVSYIVSGRALLQTNHNELPQPKGHTS